MTFHLIVLISLSQAFFSLTGLPIVSCLLSCNIYSVSSLPSSDLNEPSSSKNLFLLTTSSQNEHGITAGKTLFMRFRILSAGLQRCHFLHPGFSATPSFLPVPLLGFTYVHGGCCLELYSLSFLQSKPIKWAKGTDSRVDDEDRESDKNNSFKSLFS